MIECVDRTIPKIFKEEPQNGRFFQYSLLESIEIVGKSVEMFWKFVMNNQTTEHNKIVFMTIQIKANMKRKDVSSMSTSYRDGARCLKIRCQHYDSENATLISSSCCKEDEGEGVQQEGFDRNVNRRIQKHVMKKPLIKYLTSSPPSSASIFTLMKYGKWRGVRKIMQSPSGGNYVKSDKNSSNQNILGMALTRRAPCDIVALILRVNPHLVQEQDVSGAVPLHLGCLNGISVETMNMIFEVDGGKSARTMDNNHQTALHNAVLHSCGLILSLPFPGFASLDWPIKYKASVQVIKHLLSIAPETVHFISTDGHCPLDILHEFRNDYDLSDEQEYRIDELYFVIKTKSIEVYRNRKKGWELEGKCN